MVDVDQTLAKAVRVGVLEECLHEDQVVLLGQRAEMSHDRSVPTKIKQHTHTHTHTSVVRES